MKVKIVKIGNSKGIRIPKVLLRQTGIDDEVNLEVKDDQISLYLYDAEYLGERYRSTFIYLDLKGNLIKKEVKPESFYEKYKDMEVGARGEHKGKEYLLIENEEKEVWELHISKNSEQ